MDHRTLPIYFKSGVASVEKLQLALPHRLKKAITIQPIPDILILTRALERLNTKAISKTIQKHDLISRFILV
jgi:hypothetical protein